VDPVGNDGPPQNARIVFISPAVDAASGTAPVVVELANRNHPLRLGASVRVRLENSSGGTERLLYRLPREAFPGEALNPNTEVTLLVIDKGQVSSRRVKVVEDRGGDLVVNGPLTLSDRVILDGAGVEEGDAVLAGEEAP
jgi:multidrug efflux pump subunit AcrA (membrane-fusion protein)